ncbi:hypothetical protein NQ315_017538 [Exocentrus adspersus]|uniref:Retrotransposon gag domain-containing protein n=1 Tax=Exocentrus adspersus TaxID=1586481 RepID=A0AAV8VJW0_9CUCU|nr:hypothetical protein NQ315_017538 [Exocentrus adspersus]
MASSGRSTPCQGFSEAEQHQAVQNEGRLVASLDALHVDENLSHEEIPVGRSGNQEENSSLRAEVSTDTQRTYSVMPDLSRGLDIFDGKGGYQEAENWLEDVKATARRQFWCDSILLEMARQHLKGSALKWYRYHQTEIRSWKDFEEKFKRNYSNQRTLAERFRAMSARIQQAGEPVEDYFYDKMRMCKSLKLSFKESKQLIIGGLKSKDAANTLLPDVKVNGKEIRAYFDLGSQICALREDYVSKLKLNCDWSDEKEIAGYGGAITKTLGSTCALLNVDGVEANVKIHIVPFEIQTIPLLVGHPYTEQPHVRLVKTADRGAVNYFKSVYKCC